MPKRPLHGAFVCQCLVLLGLLFLVPQIGETFADVTKAAQSEVFGTARSFAERSQPYGGEEFGLPLMARETVRMIRRFSLKDYSLSSGVRRIIRTHQRIIEGAWPVPYNADSPNRFLRLQDRLPPQCVVQRAGRAVVYAVCS